MKKIHSVISITYFVLFCLAATSQAALEIWAGVNGNGANDASFPFKDLIWQNSGWTWAHLEDNGTRESFFGYTDRYPWPIQEVPEGVETAAQLDENNFPTEVPFTYQGDEFRPVWLFNWLIPLEIYPFGTYTFIAEGTGVVEFGWVKEERIELTGGKTVYQFNIDDIPESDITNDNTFNDGQGPKASALMMTILESDPDDHVRNIHLIRPDLQGGDSWVNDFETCPLNPQWLEDHRLYKTLRFMDWNHANNNGVVNWEDRITPNKCASNNTIREHATYLTMEWITGNHVPYEFQIAAVNALGCDYWLNIPARANEDYVRNLANLINDNLNEDITVYVEWANETWNTMFLGLHSTNFVRDNYNSNVSNLFDAHAYMSTRNTKIFREVMGTDRIVGVLAGQAANSGVGNNIMDAMSNSSINPDNVTMDAYAVTGYFGGGGPNANSSYYNAAKATADQNNLRLLMYEGGTESGKGPNMYTLFEQALEQFDNFGFECYNAFVAVAGFMAYGNWGHMEYVNQPLEDAHKYRAMYDWAVEHNQFDPNEPMPTCQALTSVKPAPKQIQQSQPGSAQKSFVPNSWYTLDGKVLQNRNNVKRSKGAGVMLLQRNGKVTKTLTY